jgi:hypothetical protein
MGLAGNVVMEATIDLLNAVKTSLSHEDASRQQHRGFDAVERWRCHPASHRSRNWRADSGAKETAIRDLGRAFGALAPSYDRRARW